MTPYKLYDLCVETTLPLHLPQSKSGHKVSIKRGDSRTFFSTMKQKTVGIWTNEQQEIIHLPGIATFVIVSTSEILIDSPYSDQSGLLGFLLITEILPRLQNLRHCIVLRGCVLNLETHSIALLGTPRCGKSSLLARWLSNNHTFLSDRWLIIPPSTQSPLPESPSILLWQDQEEWAKKTHASFNQVRPELPLFWCTIPNLFTESPKPLTQIILLSEEKSESDSDSEDFKPIKGIKKIEKLLHFMPTACIPDTQHLLTVCNKTSISYLNIDKKRGTLEELYHKIETFIKNKETVSLYTQK